MARRKYEPGKHFIVPLMGGGHAFGYITFYERSCLMCLCDIYDHLSWEPELPEDIENKPLILQDLRIGTEEFRMKPEDSEEYGAKWILTKNTRSGTVGPKSRFFVVGDDVQDIKGEFPKRPATEKDKETLQCMGFGLPPGPVCTIEVAIRRIDIDRDDFHPEDFPRN